MGNARTALFNYLFTKANKGVFVLRIEDTDRERSRPEWEEDALENLRWLGLQWDEGPDREGPYGPYRQSERAAGYRKRLEELLAKDKAYRCYCAKEELEAMRQDQQSRGEAPRYTGKCRQLTKEEVERKETEGRTSIIRFLTPSRTLVFDDLIRGKISMDTGLLGDFVLAKDLESPLYNFSVVVDDFDMAITHVIRGEDHLPNTPKQILLQEALGLPPVAYAHLPLLLAEDRTKLSKRHGDNSLTRFRKEGYLPEAVINFLALLGWNPGDERDIFRLSDLLKEFSLKRVQKAGAVLNLKRLDWLNGQYIRMKSTGELAELCAPYLEQANLLEEISKGRYRVVATGKQIGEKELSSVVALYQERLKRLGEITNLADFFFQEKLSYEATLLSWKETPPAKTQQALERVGELLGGIEEKDWNKEEIAKILLPAAEEEKDRGFLLWPLRVALTGREASAGPFEVAEALGRTKTFQRIEEAKAKL